jgi:hypothetical protein
MDTDAAPTYPNGAFIKIMINAKARLAVAILHPSVRHGRVLKLVRFAINSVPPGRRTLIMFVKARAKSAISMRLR